MNLMRAESEANKILESFSFKKAPIPVEEIAKSYNIQLHYEAYDSDISGMLIRDGKNAVIGVNSSHSPTRQRFTIAHELGHFILHEGTSMYVDKAVGFKVNFRDEFSSKAVNPAEIEANAFAASLLMPKDLVIKAVIEKLKDGVDLSHDSAEIGKIADKFKVSQQALYIRLAKIGFNI